MSRTIISTLAIAGVLVGTGCFRAPDPVAIDGRGRPVDDYGYTESSLITVENGQQNGDMGSIRAFSAAARDMSGYGNHYTPEYSNLRLDSVGDSWWVMSVINISGDLAGPEFAPGSHHVFTSGTYDGRGPSASVTGCSGPEFGNYTFDASSSNVEISVEALANGMRRMTYEVQFDDGAVTRGSLDYRVERDSTREGI